MKSPSGRNLTRKIAPVNMRPAIEFSAKHNIKPHLKLFSLDDLPKMVDIMVSLHVTYSLRPTSNLMKHDNKTGGRLGVQF